VSNSYPSNYQPSLPLGVAILAVLIGLFGLLYLIIGILGLVGSGVLAGAVPALAGTGLVAALILLVVGVVILVIASGLWDQELWALVLCILVVGAVFFLDLLAGRLFTFGGIVSGLLLIYLVAVHNHFS
jgi:hypothetical protein